MKVKKRSHLFLGWMCAGVILFFAVHQARMHTPTLLDKVFSCFLYPFLTTQSLVITPIQAITSWAKTSNELQQEIAELHKEVDFFKTQAIELAGTYQFENDTQEIRDYKQQYEHTDACLARVLVKLLDDKEQSMYIQGGARKQFEENMPVIYKNCIVGRISQVFPYYSKVTLITDPTCKIGARCLHSQAQGIVQGSQKIDTVTLTHVSHLATLQEGDLILSSGDGLIFPQGFGLARVRSFTKQDLFYEVEAEPLVDVSKLTYCYVFRDPQTHQKKNASVTEPASEAV